MLNRVSFLGYICGRGQYSHTPAGVPRLRVELSVNGRRGDRTEEATYDVIITKETAERLSDIDLMDRQLWVEGALSSENGEPVILAKHARLIDDALPRKGVQHA